MLKLQRQQLTAHISIVKGDTTSVTNMPFLFKRTLMFTGIINLIANITQNKNFINFLQNNITTKTQHNGSFFSHKKQHFY